MNLYLMKKKINFDLIVKDQFFHKKQIILYFIFLIFFFPLVIVSGILPIANYHKYKFEINENLMIKFIQGRLTLINENNKEIIKYKEKKYNLIFLLISLLWVLLISCFINILILKLK